MSRPVAAAILFPPNGSIPCPLEDFQVALPLRSLGPSPLMDVDPVFT